MNALERIKNARSKEELADGLEPIIASLVLIAEDTLPKVLAMEDSLASSEGQLRLIREAAQELKKAKRGQGWRFFGLCLAVGILAGAMAPVSYLVWKEHFTTEERSKLMSESAEKWSYTMKNFEKVSPEGRVYIYDTLKWSEIELKWTEREIIHGK